MNSSTTKFIIKIIENNLPLNNKKYNHPILLIANSKIDMYDL
jgi:hypothetical protein